MHRSDLAARFLARDELTPEQEAEAVRVLGALLAQRRLSLGRLDAGRSKAWESGRQWVQRVRDAWKAEAREILKTRPEWIESVKRLSFEVLAVCTRKGFVRRDGKPHDQATIYHFLLKTPRGELLPDPARNCNLQDRDNGVENPAPEKR